jgi:hypothetical protein
MRTITLGNALCLNFQNLAPIVVAALRAGAVRELGFIAAITHHQVWQCQFIMRSAVSLPPFGWSMFWDCTHK